MSKPIHIGDTVQHRYRRTEGVVERFEHGDRWVIVKAGSGPIRWLYAYCQFVSRPVPPAAPPVLPGHHSQSLHDPEHQHAAYVPTDDKADVYVAKRDAGKPRFDLLEEGVPDALLGLVDVLTWAVMVKGYKEHSWRTVPDAIRRYQAARARHINAINRGETHDPESGLLHDLHVLACQVFISQLRIEATRTAALNLS